MWVLIFMVFTNYETSPPAIASVPGFTSEQACKAAGAAMASVVPQVPRNWAPEYRMARHVCVKA